jgi:hypothetical protein
MTLLSMYIYHIEVNHFKYEIISWQNIPQKISDICLRFGSEYPYLGNPPMGVNSASLVTATSGRIFRSEPKHMTDIISPIFMFKGVIFLRALFKQFRVLFSCSHVMIKVFISTCKFSNN